MKKLLFIALVLLTVSCYSQEFMGVEVDGTMSSLIQKLNAKGFKLVSTEDNILEMKGNIGANEVQLLAFFSPISKICWKFAIYLPKRYEWGTLKNDYMEYKQVLTQKYGLPKENYSAFLSPYKEGDGDEMLAVSADKTAYTAFYGDNVQIEISKYSQVCVRLQNNTNADIMQKEKSSQIKQAF